MVEIGDRVVGLPDESGKTVGSESIAPGIGDKVVVFNTNGKSVCTQITSPSVGDSVVVTPSLGGKDIVIQPGTATPTMSIFLTVTGTTHVWRSIDGGLTWSDRGALSAYGSGTATSIEYMGNGIVLIAMSDEHTGNPVPQIYRSSDYGSTWSLVFSLPKPPASLWGYFGSITRISNTECLACTIYSTAYMYKSYDAGITWSIFDATSYIWQTDQVSGRTLIGSKTNTIRRTTTGGSSWSVVATLPYSVNNGSLLYCGDGYAMVGGSPYGSGAFLYRSRDYGVTWVDVATVACPGADRFCYCGNRVILLSQQDGSSQCYVWRSVDGGVTWTRIQVLGTYEVDLASVGDGVAVSTSYNGLCYRSTDYGATWTYIRSFGSATRPVFGFSAPIGTV